MNRSEQSYREMEKHFLPPLTMPQESGTPRLIFVFASPGAGKSTYVKPVLNRLITHGAAVNLEIDELKTFIPAGLDIAKTADAWFSRLVDKAIEERRSIIIFRQRSMLRPGQTLGIYKKAKACGYLTQASFVALDKERSRLGMVHRYEFALDKAMREGTLDRENYPRKPDFLCHYIFYKALPATLCACSLCKAVDIVDVYDRQGARLAYEDKAAGVSSRLSPFRAVRHERTRGWNIWEINKFNRRRGEAETKMKEHGRSLFERLKFRFLTATFKNR